MMLHAVLGGAVTLESDQQGPQRLGAGRLHAVLEDLPHALSGSGLVLSARLVREPEPPHPLFAEALDAWAEGFPLSPASPLAESLRRLAQQLDRPGSVAVGGRLFEALLAGWLGAYAARPASTGWASVLQDPALRRMLEAFHAAPGADWRMAQLVEAAGLSRSALTSRMTEKVVTTPAAYVASVRIALARRLLRRTDLEIKAIATRVGYASGPALSRAFARGVGIPPVLFRRDAWAREGRYLCLEESALAPELRFVRTPGGEALGTPGHLLGEPLSRR